MYKNNVNFHVYVSSNRLSLYLCLYTARETSDVNRWREIVNDLHHFAASGQTYLHSTQDTWPVSPFHSHYTRSVLPLQSKSLSTFTLCDFSRLLNDQLTTLFALAIAIAGILHIVRLFLFFSTSLSLSLCLSLVQCCPCSHEHWNRRGKLFA